MKTNLGLFPINGTMSLESLDSISIACSLLTLEQLDNSQLSKKQVATREGIAKLYLESVDFNPEKKSRELFRNNFTLISSEALEEYSRTDTFYPSTYLDEDDGKLKQFPDIQYHGGIVKLFKSQYYNNLYGESYKKKEVNIIFEERDGDDWSAKETGVIYADDIMRKAQDQKETVTDFESDIEVQESLQEMRELHKHLLRTERVDFRELLINYFNIEQHPQEVIQQSQIELENLIAKQKEPISDVLSNYLLLRKDGRIPKEFLLCMF